MRRVKRLLFVSLMIVSSVWAGDRHFTMEEAIMGSYSSLRVENISQLGWAGNTDVLCCVDSLGNGYGLVTIDSRTGRKEMLVSLDSLKTAVSEAAHTDISRFPRIKWLDDTSIYFITDKRVIVYNTEIGKAEVKNTIPEHAENVQVEKKSFNIAYTVENNVYVRLASGWSLQVTRDGGNGIVNGSSVHRHEFGISKGLFWSPDARYIAFYRKDERNIAEYPLVDITDRPAKARLIRYPMAGMASEEVTLGVYDCMTGSTTFLQTGQPADQYLTHVTWSPDSRKVFVSVLNRDQNHMKFRAYDPVSGRCLGTLFEERSNAWVEPQHDPAFIPGSNDRFLWISKRDGFANCYLYSTEGRLIRKVTSFRNDVNRIDGFDTHGKTLFVSVAQNNGMENHVFAQKIRGGRPVKITDGPGIHRISANSAGTMFIDWLTSHTVPRRITVSSTEGANLTTLLDAPNPLEEYELGDVQFLNIKNTNGDLLNARMILPPGFDPEKKYPVIVYVYGGPHGQMIRDSWMSGWSLWLHYMAQRGYIMFSMDNRGTNNRGRDFEQAVFRRLGTVELEDQMTGIDYLKDKPWVDAERIGVHGWSYGGFMTITMMTRTDDVFAAGVAGGPVVDWSYYEVMYGERYMDTPQSNPEGYKNACLLNYIDSLNGKLLIIHGTVDPIVMWQNSLQYLRKAVDAGKQLDYFVYPGDEHNMHGRDRIHLYQKITDYFIDNL